MPESRGSEAGVRDPEEPDGGTAAMPALPRLFRVAHANACHARFVLWFVLSRQTTEGRVQGRGKVRATRSGVPARRVTPDAPDPHSGLRRRGRQPGNGGGTTA